MTRDEVVARLRELGTAQNRKIYARHGVGEDQFGVSYANLKALRKSIKTDHDLAIELWATGNHDARVLATMIADPSVTKAKLLDDWARDLSNYVLANALAALVGKSPHASKKAEKWTASRSEWIAQAGWDVVALSATNDDATEDAFFEGFISRIERDIHASPNRVRHAMNGALIAIGMRNESLRTKAIEAAGRIGKIEVDHGETGCKTPDAAEYIRTAVAKLAARKAKA